MQTQVTEYPRRDPAAEVDAVDGNWSLLDKLDLMRDILPISGTRPRDLATFRLLGSIRKDVERMMAPEQTELWRHRVQGAHLAGQAMRRIGRILLSAR